MKDDITGKESIYTEFQGFEIMFHVSTLLPFHPDDPQKLERKFVHLKSSFLGFFLLANELQLVGDILGMM